MSIQTEIDRINANIAAAYTALAAKGATMPTAQNSDNLEATINSISMESGGMTKLWTNPNPTSNFAAQTITVPGLANSNCVEVSFDVIAAGSAFDVVTVRCEKDLGGPYSAFGAVYDGAVYLSSRMFTINWEAETITFNTAKQNGGNRDNRIIPLFVYDIS